jgi:predicted house-cleaning noncanonical NTP pyrophosphatase (MazG superfamily)
MKYNKLVRDRIPDIIRKSEKKFSMHVATEQEYEEALWNKLDEEVAEFKQDVCEEEAADVLEVVGAIVQFYGYNLYDVETAKQIKADTRGRFEGRVILEEVSDK